MDEENKEELFDTENQETVNEEQPQPTEPQPEIQPEPEKVEAPKLNMTDDFINNKSEREPYPRYSPGQQGTYSYRPPQNNGAYNTQYNSQYNAPYNTQPPYGQNMPYNTQPPKPKKKKTGLIVFVSILAAVVLVALTALITTSITKSSIVDNSSSQSGTTRAEDKNAPMLEIEDKGVIDDTEKEVKPGEVMTPTQIAARASKISVGVFVYADSTKSLAGEGTGIIMGLDDNKQYTYVITCAHVVNDEGISVSIETYDNKTYDAEIVGFDSRTDVAVLKIKTNKYAAASFGNSNNLKVGEAVYAIGNPGGTEFSGSFTSGIVSAIERPVSSEIGYTMKCLQHTATINPGNSGGALLNSFGQVIGINSSKIIASGYEGMCFAIPITDARIIVNKLIKYGYVTDRAKLGISYYTASSSEQYSMLIQLKGLPAGSLIIGKINSDSDLYGKAENYDIITAVDGKQLTTSDILLEKIENGKIGQELKLTIARFDNNYNMKTFTVNVKLVEDKETAQTTGDNSQREEQTTDSFFFNPFE